MTGIDWHYLFTSFEGRVNRQLYWIGMIALVVFVIVLVVIGSGLFGAAFYGAPISILQLLLLYPAAAVTVKRLHDRNRPTYFVYFILVPVVLSTLLDLFGFSDPLDPSTLDMLLGMIVFAVSIWFLIELGFLKGTTGPNAYGPDPLGPGQADARMEGT